MGYEWLALGAAMLWAISSLISMVPARHLGAFAYSRWRMACVTLMLSSMAFINGGWATMTFDYVTIMMLSGVIGIFIGDTALFSCFTRIGPRRGGLLFSCHAVFSALLGIWLFNESLLGWKLIGGILVFSGIVTAIFFGQRQSDHSWEDIQGKLWVAIALGLTAALCQSLGAIIAKPVMQTSIDPIAASAVRMASAFAAHFTLRISGANIAKPTNPITLPILGMVAINGFLAMAVGMTLILYALRYGDVGMVALLSSTSPIMILPLLWVYTRRPPSLSAWIGAALAVIGTSLIVSH
ncbi:EamA/RhaT family transporter [Photobacterium profundum]|uniref:Transporter, drug/metabolite exporter family protein n=1 Tax=Photobacterium profundum 3TCK TaxID=314280 RepID=Q1Z0R0_9GAMM|nr:DMT family transporter [Photobacterium profundum]EAS42057.1 transporter, drug/metabolite exporter family protein [Photobacterium profundum 3TCK]PSV59570.1 EamA/RhaT family transporter [Photobacterium profundum]